MTDIFYENTAGAEQTLFTFPWLCRCLMKTFWSLCFSMYQLSHVSLRNALCMSMAICISTMSCCVLRSLPFSKTCEKVFEMSLSKGFNIHSTLANVRYKFYHPKQCRIYLMKTIRGVLEEISISVSRHVFTVLWISAFNDSYLIAIGSSLSAGILSASW